MKKIISVLLIAMLVLSVVGCAKGSQTSAYADSKEVLTTVWSAFAQADKFPVGGGDSENFVADGPGNFDITKTEELDVSLALPASQTANIEEAASMMHMMNSNMFTGAAYKVKEGTDVQAFANEYKTGINTRQWMCGFPEKFVVIEVGNFVITAFGNSQNIENFEQSAKTNLEGANVILSENVSL